MAFSPAELAEYEVRILDEQPGPAMLGLVHRPTEHVVVADEKMTLRVLLGAAGYHRGETPPP